MSKRILFPILITCFSFIQVELLYGQLPGANKKNILYLNSYHQGFLWSDSICNGIIRVIKSNPEYSLYIENLHSKQFGQSHFNTVSQYLSEKYSGISFDGVLVSDNDALDFTFWYKNSLFPDVPVVFAGISNPDDYPLEGLEFYGFKETAPTDSVLDLLRKLVPHSKKILLLSDNTTTGRIYRKEFKDQESQFKDIEIIFPEVVHLDSIYKLVSSENKFDAIFYIGINQDESGEQVDTDLFVEKIGALAKVPLFANDPIYIGKGVLGGLYQNGAIQGAEAAKLLILLLNSTDREEINHINTTEVVSFVDYTMAHRYGISMKDIPEGTVIFNQKSILNKTNFGALVSVLVLLSLATVFLLIVNRKRKKKQRKSDSQIRKIESRKNQLEEASRKLSIAISELEETNNKLNETNAYLLEAKKKAEESDNLKSAFLANVSHEIRTPLNSIVGFSSLLGDSELDEQTRNSYMDLIESNSESLLVLIDEILDLSKIEAHQLALKMQNFSVDDLISELFLIFNQGKTSSMVELRVGEMIVGKTLSIISDRVRVKQIFINLLSNAFKFTDKGFVEFGYFLSETGEVILYVKDTGIGVREEHHEVIFNRFQKLNEDTSRIYRGTGLGLAITQKLTELLGGRIWIESEQGKGSTFFFTLKDCELKQNPN